MEIQQTSLYQNYLQRLGWQVLTLDGVNIFLKHFPLLGGLAKIQRPRRLPNLKKIIPLLKSHKVRTVAVEPDTTVEQKYFETWVARLGQHFKLNHSPYLPTKTSIVDLTFSEKDIFQRFTEAKRRGIRRALKHGVTIAESTDINSFIQIKNKSAGFLGFITTSGVRELWEAFTASHATILLAYSPESPPTIIGGLLLLFHKNIAYYWIAGATHKGKKMFAPTLLVWEALKLAKKRGCTIFDFVGVWDERLPNKNKEWGGFTKFKEGFGGKPVYYPLFQ